MLNINEPEFQKQQPTIEDGVGRLGGADGGGQELIEPISVITDADLELHWGIDGTDHAGVQEGRVQFEFSPAHEFLAEESSRVKG